MLQHYVTKGEVGVCANIVKTSCACLCATPVRECAQYVRIVCVYVLIGGYATSLSRQITRVRLCPYLCAMCDTLRNCSRACNIAK